MCSAPSAPLLSALLQHQEAHFCVRPLPVGLGEGGGAAGRVASVPFPRALRASAAGFSCVSPGAEPAPSGLLSTRALPSGPPAPLLDQRVASEEQDWSSGPCDCCIGFTFGSRGHCPEVDRSLSCRGGGAAGLLPAGCQSGHRSRRLIRGTSPNAELCFKILIQGYEFTDVGERKGKGEREAGSVASRLCPEWGSNSAPFGAQDGGPAS